LIGHRELRIFLFCEGSRFSQISTGLPLVTALLMADFLLNPDGQQLLKKFYYGSGAEDDVFKKWRPERGLTTDQYENEMLRWKKLLNAITRK
jgi:hypothetical protein